MGLEVNFVRGKCRDREEEIVEGMFREELRNVQCCMGWKDDGTNKRFEDRKSVV